MEINRLRSQRVMVVGGGSGMGLAVAEHVLGYGGEVLLVGRPPDKLKAAQVKLAAPGRVQWRSVDITDELAVESLFREFGELHHIVCTAADIRGAYELLPGLTLAALDCAIRSKVVAPILLAKHGAPRLAERGSLTFTSGIAAYRPRPKGVAVAAINAALEGTVRALALELAPLRVNAVSPGWVRTGIWKDVAGADTDALLGSMAQKLPVGRIGTPDDVADAILFLIGNGYTTGTVLHIEGGHRLV